MYFHLITYPVLGAGLKYIDDAFDECIFNRKIAILLAPFLGLLWAFTMMLDQFSATLLLGILVGVFLRGKIDNLAHFIGLAIIVGIVALVGISLLYLPLIFLAAAAFLDEVGNDIIDYNPDMLISASVWPKVMVYFFDQRWMTKIAVLYVIIIGVVPVYFFLAILLFDGAYLGVRLYSRMQKRTAQPVCA